jgi:hypothetical protein
VYFPYRTFVAEIPISFPFPKLPFSISFRIKNMKTVTVLVFVYRPFPTVFIPSLRWENQEKMMWCQSGALSELSILVCFFTNFAHPCTLFSPLIPPSLLFIANYVFATLKFTMKVPYVYFNYLLTYILLYFKLARSGDSTARIWTIPYGPCGSDMQPYSPGVHVLKHFKGRTNEKSKDVTTLDWNVSFFLLQNFVYIPCFSYISFFWVKTNGNISWNAIYSHLFY